MKPFEPIAAFEPRKLLIRLLVGALVGIMIAMIASVADWGRLQWKYSTFAPGWWDKILWIANHIQRDQTFFLRRLTTPYELWVQLFGAFVGAAVGVGHYLATRVRGHRMIKP